ncbi:protein of unknown function [Azospirillum baldaniorum]|uniref:Uncharacterized protein n=1 Tax=Azospirillum baldaniorum TaxID=1064539 RepID=A0A9P1NN93_9PROT|nr:protein of unknown function [Azospirillum baldaniorum]
MNRIGENRQYTSALMSDYAALPHRVRRMFRESREWFPPCGFP